MSYASKEWTEKYVGQTLKTAKTQGLLGGGGSLGDLYFDYENYTEEEVVIGRWTDGKPVYRKFIRDTRTISNVVQYFNVGASIDEYNRVYGYLIVPSEGGLTPLPYPISTASDYITYVLPYIHDHPTYPDKIRITFGNGYKNKTYDIYLIIEYTKTTDEPDSFNTSLITSNVKIASAPSYDNYSEEEIVVGKWIDGKPLYRKNLSFTPQAASSTTKSFKHNIDNIDNIIDIRGMFKQTSGDYLPSSSWAGTGNYLWLFASKDYINYQNVGWTPMLCQATLLYTKTTDEPNSFKPEMIKNDVLEDVVSQQDVDDVVSILE